MKSNQSISKFPNQQILIEECGESLIPIPLEKFAFENPHPYEKLGAPYQGKSPYYLRFGVVNALIQAQNNLQQLYPGWRIFIFDAYRPIEVQQFMVEYAFKSAVAAKGLKVGSLSPAESEEIWNQVYQFWAIPSENPATPPPHSTGSAVDITLVDHLGNVMDMGGEIDELSERSFPEFYANTTKPEEVKYHQNRELLNKVMRSAGFLRLPTEWWHFSLGDRIWAKLYNQENPTSQVVARYGRI